MRRRALLVSALLAFPWIAAAGDKPNLLVIPADDFGWGDMHCCNPDSRIPTANVDRLAREGMMFTNVHTPAALCDLATDLVGVSPRRPAATRPDPAGG